MNPEVTKKWRDAFFGRGGIKKKKEKISEQSRRAE
jgi:hypothetical protein